MKVVRWLWVWCFFCLSCHAQEFKRVAVYRGWGALVASMVGPGPTEGSQRLYLSYLYDNNTIDTLAVDPETGAVKVFPNPAPTESGAWAITAGPDGCIYLGTLPCAHFLKLDPQAGTLVDLGRPSATEGYIWDLAFGTDRKLYGVTYPQAKLVRYDPASGKLEDLGRMDPEEMYAHFVAGSEDGFIYAGIGMSKANIAAYEIATGKHREVLPPAYQKRGLARIYRGRDGRVYGTVGDTRFRMQGWTATPIKLQEAAPGERNKMLKDGRLVAVDDHRLIVTNTATHQGSSHLLDYAGNRLDIFRIGFGPDGKLYGSSVLPMNLLRVDEARGAVDELGGLGGGEVYSFLSHQGRLLAAAYSGAAPLFSFDTTKPFTLGSAKKNPALASFAGEDRGWRPQAMIEGPGGKVYVGAIAGYGKLGGPLVAWDTERNILEPHPDLVKDLSVDSLAVWKNLLVIGMTPAGGGGSHPTRNEARLLLWDPALRKIIFETSPVAGGWGINDLITAPGGLVYGFSNGTLFVFDPVSRTVKHGGTLPFSNAIYDAVTLGPDGKIWGVAGSGIFVIDPATDEVSIVARPPKPITAGFAMKGRSIYYASGPEVWSWTPH